MLKVQTFLISYVTQAIDLVLSFQKKFIKQSQRKGQTSQRIDRPRLVGIFQPYILPQ